MRTIESIQSEYGTKIAKRALELEAIRLNPSNPFRWASGYYMPIYNDNRRLLADSDLRMVIAQGFSEIITLLEIEVTNIAGTATAGIPHATTLADLLGKSLSYVRSSGKDHGLKNLIEGLDSTGTYHLSKVLLIEDLISTGLSSIKAIEAIRSSKGVVEYCLAIFTYGMRASLNNFASLSEPVTLITLLNYDTMLKTAFESGYVDSKEEKMLKIWKEDPFGWGERHGFVI